MPHSPLRRGTMPSCSRSPSPIAWCVGRGGSGRARSRLRPARSAAAERRSHRARRTGRGRLAAGDAAATPGSAVPCVMRSASICRSGGSRCRRTISRRCSARARSSSPTPPSSAGAPTVISRFVQRLAAVAGEAAVDPGARQRRDTISPGRARSISRPRPAASTSPAPKPPRAARPTTLSVTEIESWLRDPYTIYAKHILNLRELDPVDLPPGAADRGIRHPRRARRVHHAPLPPKLPPDPLRSSRARRASISPRSTDYPGGAGVLVAALPAHRALVRRLGAAAARHGRPTLQAEIRGKIDIPLGERVFTLRGRADRIEALCATAATPSSTTRPARRRPRSRCASASRRSSRSKPRSCATGDFPASPAALRSPSSSTSRSRAASRAGENKPIDFKEGDARHPRRPRARKAHKPWLSGSRTSDSPIAAGAVRCGRTATAPTTISRASRSGRSVATRKTNGRGE